MNRFSTKLDKDVARNEILQHVVAMERMTLDAELRRQHDQVQIAHKCRVYRSSVVVTQRAVAEKMGVSSQYVFELEAGRRRWSLLLVRNFLDAINSLKNRK